MYVSDFINEIGGGGLNSAERPSISKAKGLTGPGNQELYFHLCYIVLNFSIDHLNWTGMIGKCILIQLCFKSMHILVPIKK